MGLTCSDIQDHRVIAQPLRTVARVLEQVRQASVIQCLAEGLNHLRQLLRLGGQVVTHQAIVTEGIGRRLAALTGKTLKQGLELLGLDTLERM